MALYKNCGKSKALVVEFLVVVALCMITSIRTRGYCNGGVM